MADNNSMKLQEGVQASQTEIKSELQIKRTTAAATALLALTLYAGSPTPVKAETPTDNKAVATIVVNTEYEKIISEAKKQGKDPVEYARAKKESGEWTVSNYLSFGKYIRQIQDQAAITRTVEEGKIDQAAIEDRLRIEGKKEVATARTVEEGKIDQELINKGKSLIVIFEGLIREGKFTTKEEAIVNRMYGSVATPKIIKDELLAKFGKYITNGVIVAQNSPK